METPCARDGNGVEAAPGGTRVPLISRLTASSQFTMPERPPIAQVSGDVSQLGDRVGRIGERSIVKASAVAAAPAIPGTDRH